MTKLVGDEESRYIEDPSFAAAAAFTGGRDGVSYSNQRFAEGSGHSSDLAKSLEDYRPPDEKPSSLSSVGEGGLMRKRRAVTTAVPWQEFKQGFFLQGCEIIGKRFSRSLF